MLCVKCYLLPGPVWARRCPDVPSPAPSTLPWALWSGRMRDSKDAPLSVALPLEPHCCISS